ncbi:MAG: hypothetical protein U1D30_09225 [Planctomycetota bacterium]
MPLAMPNSVRESEENHGSMFLQGILRRLLFAGVVGNCAQGLVWRMRRLGKHDARIATLRTF